MCEKYMKLLRHSWDYRGSNGPRFFLTNVDQNKTWINRGSKISAWINCGSNVDQIFEVWIKQKRGSPVDQTTWINCGSKMSVWTNCERKTWIHHRSWNDPHFTGNRFIVLDIAVGEKRSLEFALWETKVLVVRKDRWKSLYWARCCSW